MANPLEQFCDAIRKDMTVVLATAAGGRVTMRLVSPVYYAGDILMFTDAGSEKYRQLRENPNCCLAAGGFFAETAATFCGGTMLPENQALRDAYCAKFPDAFEEGAAFGGRNAEFLLLKPTRLTGWTFPEDASAAADFPTVPFALDLLQADGKEFKPAQIQK